MDTEHDRTATITYPALDDAQIQRWAAGQDTPDLEQLKAIATSLGNARIQARTLANDQLAPQLRALVPILYRSGITSINQICRVTGFTRMVMDDILAKAGIVRTGLPQRHDITAEKDVA